MSQNDSNPDLNEDSEERQRQFDTERAALLANWLVSNNSDYTRLVGMMIAARQTYALCVHEMQELSARTDWKQAVRSADGRIIGDVEVTEAQKGIVHELLTGSTAVEAQKPFASEDLEQSLSKTVIPWMQALVKGHKAAAMQIAAERRREAENRRTSSKIRLPFSASTESPEFDRARPVTLVGKKELLRLVIQDITAFLGKTASDVNLSVRQVVRLLSFDDDTERVGDPAVFTIATNSLWHGCASTNEKFQRVYLSLIFDKLRDQVDVLIVDDPINTVPGGGTKHGNVAAFANEAQRKLGNWSKLAGALLIGCLETNEDVSEGLDALPGRQSLVEHTHVLRVTERPSVDSELRTICVNDEPILAVSAKRVEEVKNLQPKTLVRGL